MLICTAYDATAEMTIALGPFEDMAALELCLSTYYPLLQDPVPHQLESWDSAQARLARVVERARGERP